MIKIGDTNELFVIKIDKAAIYLGSEMKNNREPVRLPVKEASENIKTGEKVKVFIYKDAEGQLTATFKEPLGKAGELAYLKVIDISNIGAFLSWGLEKDLFLPIREQTVKAEKGNSYLVKIYLDKSKRLCATMKIDKELTTGSLFKPGDMVKGTVYSINPRIGTFVAVENKYYGFVPNAENFKKYTIGSQDLFRVIRIREDGRIDLSSRQLSYRQMETDAQDIINLLMVKGGFIPLNDKSSPEEINRYLSISKNAFKKALGKLLKERKVTAGPEGIRFIQKKNN